MNLKPIFEAIDAKDADGFASFLSPTCEFRFANADPVIGRDAIRDVVAGFFDALKGLDHDLAASWQGSDYGICRGQVTYTRLDDSQLSIPFAVIMGIANDQVTDYRIYCDNSALFA